MKPSPNHAGLPTIAWDESDSAMKCSRRCFIAEGDDGSLQFVHEWRTVTGWQGHLWVVGVAAIAGGFAAMAVVALIHDNLLGYTTMSPSTLVLVLLATLIGATLAGHATYRYFAVPEIAQLAAPWNELKAFAVTDNQALLGASKVRQNIAGGPVKPVDPTPVIFADFGDTREPMVISLFNFSQKALMQLRGDLSVEFVDRRPEHLARLMRKERDLQNAATGVRRKVV